MSAVGSLETVTGAERGIGSTSRHADTSAARGNVELTLVVPFYNPGPSAIHQTISEAQAALRGAGVTFEIIAVSDGSTDGSSTPECHSSVRTSAAWCSPRTGARGGPSGRAWPWASVSTWDSSTGTATSPPSSSWTSSEWRAVTPGGHGHREQASSRLGDRLPRPPSPVLVRIPASDEASVRPQGPRHADRDQDRPPRRRSGSPPSHVRGPIRLRYRDDRVGPLLRISAHGRGPGQDQAAAHEHGEGPDRGLDAQRHGGHLLASAFARRTRCGERPRSTRWRPKSEGSPWPAKWPEPATLRHLSRRRKPASWFGSTGPGDR